MGNFEAAVAYFHQGLDAAQRVNVPWETASLWNGLGEVARSQGHIEEALAHYAKALEISEELGNRWMIAHVLDNIGHAAYSQGRYDVARDHFRGSLEASVALGDERGIAMCLEKLGGVAITQKQLEFAATLLGAAEALREARNTPVEGMDAADYRHFAEQLQQQLAADVLRTAWDAGRTLPLSIVLARILDQ
ncbi:MAG: tetratricopeptide repeat protein [Chloroflexi bacterium]|nr:tetratricopeptide repeat protein [Chloroflexota bacterium]